MKSLLCYIGIFLGLRACSLASDLIVRDRDDDVSDSSTSKNKAQMFNFASQAAGAVVLDKSPASAKGYHNLLNDDKDKYGISPCDEKKWVVIGLSEEVLITSVELLNYEKYSSMLRDFQLLASSSYPTDEWINLGTYTAMPQLGSQSFNITDLSEAHTRYLKVKFLTHYSDEALCTLSQIKVFGMTVIAAFQQEVQRSDHSMRDMLSQLNSEQPTAQLLEAIADSTSAEDAANSAEVQQQQDIGVDEPGNETVTVSEAAADLVPEGESAAAAVEQQEAALQEVAESVEGKPTAPVDAGVALSGEIAVVGAADGDAADVVPPEGDLPFVEANGSAVPSAATDVTAAVDSAANPTAEETVCAEFTDKYEAPPVPAAQVEDEPESHRFGSFDLAGKVKKLLPGLFGTPETPAEDAAPGKSAEDCKLEKIDEAEAAAEGGAGVTAVEETDTTAAVDDTLAPTARNSTGVLNDSVSTNSSQAAPVTAQEEAEGAGTTAKEPPAGERNGVPSDTANALNGSTSDAVEGDSALNLTKEGDAGVAESNITVTVATKQEEGNGTAENPPGPAATSPTSDRAVSRSAEAPSQKANLSSAVMQSSSSGAAKINITSVNASGALGVVVNPLPTVAAASATNATMNCLDTLSFADFSRKMRAKLQQYSANNSTGNSSAEDAQGAALSGKESNVFKSLMQKIKTLEMNSAIVEMYAVQMSECFRTVAKELVARPQCAPARQRSSSGGHAGGGGADSEQKVGVLELMSHLWRIAAGGATGAEGAEEARLLAQLLWEFLEDNLAAVLLGGLLYCVFSLAIAAGVVYLLLKSTRR